RPCNDGARPIDGWGARGGRARSVMTRGARPAGIYDARIGRSSGGCRPARWLGRARWLRTSGNWRPPGDKSPDHETTPPSMWFTIKTIVECTFDNLYDAKPDSS